MNLVAEEVAKHWPAFCKATCSLFTKESLDWPHLVSYCSKTMVYESDTSPILANALSDAPYYSTLHLICRSDHHTYHGQQCASETNVICRGTHCKSAGVKLSIRSTSIAGKGAEDINYSKLVQETDRENVLF